MDRDLRIAWPPFLDAQELEAQLQQQVEVCRDRAVLLDDPRGQPVGRARAFLEIAVKRPGLMARSIVHPAWPAWRRVQRRLDRGNQAAARGERGVDAWQQPMHVH